MVLTILEAHVDPKNWSTLQDDFKTRTAQLPPQMVSTCLLHGAENPSLWQILSVWKSWEALNEMRNSGVTPTGVLMFRNVGAEPTLTIFTVSASAP
jgi:hypothetical protein